MKTEHDKLIGGFTPNKWQSQGGYVNDETGKAFLFSLTLKEKYKCISPKHSIVYNENYGPTFGGGHDIYLSDNADSSSKCYAKFPHSYNLQVDGTNKYENNQKIWTLFSGATNGNNFNVK